MFIQKNCRRNDLLYSYKTFNSNQYRFPTVVNTWNDSAERCQLFQTINQYKGQTTMTSRRGGAIGSGYKCTGSITSA